MFVSVKERARQIANGQFTVSTTSAPIASLTDPVLEAKPGIVAAPKTIGTTEPLAKAVVSPSKTKSSKVTPSKEPTVKLASSKATFSPTTIPKAWPSKPAPSPEASAPKKSLAKPKASGESSKPSSPKVGPLEPPSTSRAVSRKKVLSTQKSTTSKSLSPPLKSKRSQSPPKRVDSPIEDNIDPLSSLKTACLKQVSGVTGLRGRRLAIVLKQRSSGEWYAALKDTGSNKYLKMWTKRDKTFATKEEALEAYLAFVVKTRNEVRWFPMSPRASSPKAKGV